MENLTVLVDIQTANFWLVQNDMTEKRYANVMLGLLRAAILNRVRGIYVCSNTIFEFKQNF